MKSLLGHPPPGAEAEPAPLTARPAEVRAGGMSRPIRLALLVGDAMLLALAAALVFGPARPSGGLGLGLAVVAVGVGAWLGCLAVSRKG